jgi:ATP-dependent helicase/nuclease subunit A
LQLVSLGRTASVAELKSEAQRLVSEKALSSEEIAQLDFAALSAFWQSPLGIKIRANSQDVRRELAFTARFTPVELASATASPPELFDEDFVVVQGVADLLVLLPQEIWLVDFKTDQFAPADLKEKVRLYEPQLQYYARALSRIYRRPVTEMYLHFLAPQHSEQLEPR